MHHLASLWQAVPALAALLLVLFGGRLLAGAATFREAVRASSRDRQRKLFARRQRRQTGFLHNPPPPSAG